MKEKELIIDALDALESAIDYLNIDGQHARQVRTLTSKLDDLASVFCHLYSETIDDTD